MTIEAIIIADSISPAGIRLTTFQLRYPRFVHSEMMTHRVFSRNASSSRAIPVERMIADLRRDPAMPVYWGSNKPGMQAGEELSPEEIEAAKHNWLNSMENAIHSAQQLIDIGLHKQIANRILEPWAHINVVVTATQYENFFALRCHKDAQPEIKALADLMRTRMEAQDPHTLISGDWHLPYINAQDWGAAHRHLKIGRITRDEPPHAEKQILLIKVSVARCARVSYLTHDGRQTTIKEDLALYDRLVGGMPLHASPCEHQGQPDEIRYGPSFPGARDLVPVGYKNEQLSGNLGPGWIQYRKTLKEEFIPG